MYRLLPAALFFFFLALYLFSVGIPFPHTDSQVMYETARAIGLEHKLELPPSPLPQVIIGQNGHSYSKYDPGLPLLSAPIVAYADKVALHNKAYRYATGAVFVMIVPAAAMALAMLALFLLARQFYGIQQALVITLVTGLASTIWPYARLFLTEAVLTAMLALAVLAIYWFAHSPTPTSTQHTPSLQWLRSSIPRYIALAIASISMGFAILTRASMVIYLPGLFYLLAKLQNKQSNTDNPVLPRFFLSLLHEARERWAIFTVFSSGPVLAIVGLLWHNYLRFGTPFKTGYEGEAFSTFPLVGIMGLLVSPGKSVFVFAPPLVLSALLWPRFKRHHATLARSILIMTTCALLYYGSWWAWHGGWVWGPRFLVPLIPLWCLAWGEIPSQRVWWLAAVMIFLLGIGVQIAGTFTDTNLAYFEAFAGATDPDDETRYAMVHYDLDTSPLAIAWRQAKHDQWETQAIYHLQGTRLKSVWVDGIPKTVHRMLAVSALVIGWVVFQNGKLDKGKRHGNRKTEI